MNEWVHFGDLDPSESWQRGLDSSDSEYWPEAGFCENVSAYKGQHFLTAWANINLQEELYCMKIFTPKENQ
jgi:hypothetical protein